MTDQSAVARKIAAQKLLEQIIGFVPRTQSTTYGKVELIAAALTRARQEGAEEMWARLDALSIGPFISLASEMRNLGIEADDIVARVFLNERKTSAHCLTAEHFYALADALSAQPEEN